MGVDDKVAFIGDNQISYDDNKFKQPQNDKRQWPPNDVHFPSQWVLSNLINDADINIKTGWSEYLSAPTSASKEMKRSDPPPCYSDMCIGKAHFVLTGFTTKYNRYKNLVTLGSKTERFDLV